MVTLGSLWLPIVLSAVVVFFATWLMHMVLPHHRSDWSQIPDEAGFRESVGKQKMQPGQYMVPHCGSPKAMSDPKFLKKMEEGPVAMMLVLPSGPMRMGKSLIQSFLVNLVIAFMAAYVASFTLQIGTHYMQVFRLVGTVTILAYGAALLWDPVWKGHSWSSTMKHVFDGVVYGLLTAGVFGWLWPQ